MITANLAIGNFFEIDLCYWLKHQFKKSETVQEISSLWNDEFFKYLSNAENVNKMKKWDIFWFQWRIFMPAEITTQNGIPLNQNCSYKHQIHYDKT